MPADVDREDEPSLKQKLHAATGDRDAEAEALAEHAPPEVTEEDAKRAVQRAHGEAGRDEPRPDDAVARPTDAEQVHREREG